MKRILCILLTLALLLVVSGTAVAAQATSVPYTPWDSSNEADFYWQNGISFEFTYPDYLSDVVLCNSHEELEIYLQENNYPATYGDEYTKDYFIDHSLLLFEAYLPIGQAKWTVTDLTVNHSVLHLSLQYSTPEMGTPIAFYRVYRVEIGQKLEDVRRIRCVTSYQKSNPYTRITEYPYGSDEIVYDLGDVNGDGQIDAKDALLVLQSAVDKVDLTPPQLVAAKVLGEDALSAKDALCILQKAVNIIRYFPVEIIQYKFTPFTENTDDYDNCWTLPYSESSFPLVSVCNSTEELKRALMEKYGYEEPFSEMMENSLAQYTEAYFETNSLVLIWLRKGHTGIRLQVNQVYVAGEELNVAWTVTDKMNGGTSVMNHLYHLEVQGKLSVDSAYCSIRYWETISATQVVEKRYDQTVVL